MGNFFNFRFFVKVMIQMPEVSDVRKKSLKKIKYWQRNGGFKFWLEVKVTHLIDIFNTVFSNQFFHLKRTL